MIYRWIRFAVWPQSGKIKGIMERLYKAYYRVGSIFIVTLLAGLDHLTITLSSHWFTLYPNLIHTSQDAGGKQQPGYLCVVPPLHPGCCLYRVGHSVVKPWYIFKFSVPKDCY